MAIASLSWKLQIQGAEQVKAKLQEINSEFEQGRITSEQWSAQVNQQGRVLRGFNNNLNISKNLFLAQHPAVRNLTRAMSTFGSITRGVLAITTALNVARMQGTTLTQEETDLMLQEVDIMNKLAQARDPEEIRKYSDELVIIRERLEAIKKEKADQQFTEIATAIASIGLAASMATKSIIDFIPIMQKFGGMSRGGKMLAGGGLIGLGAGLFATGGIDALIGKSDKLEDKLKAIGGIAAMGIGTVMFLPPGIQQFALIAVAVATATVAILVFRKEIEGFFVWLGTALAPVGESFMNFFTVDLPGWFASSLETLTPLWDALKGGFTGFGNIIITVINFLAGGIVSGLNTIGQTIVDFVNRLIAKYEAMRKSLGSIGKALPQLNPLTFEPIKFTPIPLIEAATGFEGMVNKPTMFLAGEAGSEMVSISSRNRGGSSMTVVINNNIGGSILTEKKVVDITLNSLKEELRRRGFTGY